MTDPSCPSGVCGADVPPLVGSVLTGTGLTLAQAAAALERGETAAADRRAAAASSRRGRSEHAAPHRSI